jgi:predicted PurR-regulated permease PerM
MLAAMVNEAPPESPPPDGRARISAALWVLVSLLGGVILYYAHGAFIPVALAMLFALVLSSPVEALHRRGLPRSASALLILALFLGLGVVAISALWDPAQAWFAAAPRTVRTIEHKLDPAARVLRRIDVVTSRAAHLTDGVEAAQAAPKAIAPAEEGGFLVATRSVIVDLVTVVILTLFVLTGGPPVLARMATAFASNVHATHALRVIEAVRREVARYYATLAMINLGLGVATGLVMTGLGMPNPVLWGALACLLNFIPYVGSATTLVILTVVAFVSFEDVGRVIGVAGAYLALATIEGQIVQPLLVGRRLELNPIIVFLALWFAGWFWGVAGIVMAVPALVTLKVVAEHSPRGLALQEFLSPSRARGFKARRSKAK